MSCRDLRDFCPHLVVRVLGHLLGSGGLVGVGNDPVSGALVPLPATALVDPTTCFEGRPGRGRGGRGERGLEEEEERGEERGEEEKKLEGGGREERDE